MIVTVSFSPKHYFYLKSMERLERATPAKFMYPGAFLWHIVSVLAFVSLMVLLNQYWTLLKEKMAYHWIDKSKDLEEASSTRSEGRNCTAYGTITVECQNNRVSEKAFVKLYTAPIISMLLLWVTQWLFWGGFIVLRF